MQKMNHGPDCNCADCKAKYGGSKRGLKKDTGSFVPPLPFQKKGTGKAAPVPTAKKKK